MPFFVLPWRSPKEVSFNSQERTEKGSVTTIKHNKEEKKKNISVRKEKKKTEQEDERRQCRGNKANSDAEVVLLPSCRSQLFTLYLLEPASVETETMTPEY